MKVPESVLPMAGVQGDNAHCTFTGVDSGDCVALPVMRILDLQCHRPPGGGSWPQSASGMARLLAFWGV
jgi:hypothetical protein